MRCATSAAGESDAYNFNWLLRIPHDLQQPFEPTHERMAALELRRDTPPHLLAADLRRAFSGIVAGNVKEQGVRLIEQHGPFELHGDPELLRPLDGAARGVRARAAHEDSRANTVPATASSPDHRPICDAIPDSPGGRPVASAAGERCTHERPQKRGRPTGSGR